MENEFCIGGLKLSLTKGEGSLVSVGYDFAGDKYVDKIDISELKQALSDIFSRLEAMELEGKETAVAKYISPETAKRLKALGINDLDYIVKGFE